MSATTNTVIDLHNNRPLPTTIDLSSWGLTVGSVRTMTTDAIRSYFTTENISAMFGYCDETQAELHQYADLVIEQKGQTVCRYYVLDETGEVQGGQHTWYAFDDSDDRNGDGAAELEAYLADLTDNGFIVVERTGTVDVLYADIDANDIRVFEYDGGCHGSGWFGLAVVDQA